MLHIYIYIYDISRLRVNIKIGERGYCQPAIGSESLHQDSTDNGVRIGIIPHKNLLVSEQQRSLMWKDLISGS